jgi:predicted O-methyltransferase YrrM
MISIPARIYSPIIWETIRYRTKEYRDFFHFDTLMEHPATIGEHTANMLRRIAFFLKPTVVVEIGTYIGRSTLALGYGMTSGEIYTCDSDADKFPHDCQLLLPEVYIHLHSNTVSTAMLQKLTKPADLFFFDGRIQPADVEHIARLSKPDTTFLFDDFEGVEKGVANALMIQHLGGILVYPEAGQTLGMMIRKVGFSRQ